MNGKKLESSHSTFTQAGSTIRTTPSAASQRSLNGSDIKNSELPLKIKPIKSSIKESDIQKQIIQWLHLKNVFAWVNKTQGTFDPYKRVFRRNTTKKGISDIIGVLPDGRFLAIEVKTSTGRVSPEQKEFIETVQKNEGIAFVARNLESVIKELEPLIKTVYFDDED